MFHSLFTVIHRTHSLCIQFFVTPRPSVRLPLTGTYNCICVLTESKLRKPYTLASLFELYNNIDILDSNPRSSQASPTSEFFPEYKEKENNFYIEQKKTIIKVKYVQRRFENLQLFFLTVFMTLYFFNSLTAQITTCVKRRLIVRGH